MSKRWLKVGSATFAVAVLGALMVNAGTSAGCGGSRDVQAGPATADVDPHVPPSSNAPPPAVAKPGKGAHEETHFPASKAGPIFPRKPSPQQSQK